MTNEQKAIIKEKKFEAILGLIFLIPPVLGVIAFTLNMLGNDRNFAELDNLNSHWLSGDLSNAITFMVVMGIIGVWLLKGNLQYLFMKKD